MIEKTYKELARAKVEKARSRVWQDPNGFQYLAVWQNAALLRILIRKYTLCLALKNPYEKRLKAQMDDAARSVKRNIEEGWKRPTSGEYLQFLGYSQASLEEVRGDIRDNKQDGFLKSEPGSTLAKLGINLRVSKGYAKGLVKGEPTEPGHPYCQALRNIEASDLSYEVFQELINKTDWLLRKLVVSLENKLAKEKKGQEIERARIRNNVKGY